jgi:large subunit ribosomal protein L29
MKIKDIRELTQAELADRKRDLKSTLFHLRVQQQSGHLEKPSQIRAIRRDVARIETVITQKSRAAAVK